MKSDFDPDAEATNPLYSCSMDESDRLARLAYGRPALDIGANIGGYTHWLLECGLCPVHCFEPTPGPFEEMRTKYQANPSVILNNIGLSDHSCTLSGLKVYNSWTLSNATVDENSLPGRVSAIPEFSAKMTTLDEYAKEMKLNDLGFVKIDVDGYELRVLKGGRLTLSRFMPPILFEASGLGERYFGDSRYELAHFIMDLGYIPTSMNGNYRITDARDFIRCLPFHTTFDIMLVPR